MNKKGKSFSTEHPNLASEWHPTKNEDLKPENFTLGSHEKVWWICNKGHEWQATIHNRSNGRGCPYCAGKKVLIGYNDLGTTNPDVAREWHSTKNGKLRPTEVTLGSDKKVWWLCNKGHEWEAVVKSRNNGVGCPYCAGKKVSIGYNDLMTTNPNLAKEWHPTRNGELTPKDVTAGSGKKVWWVCSKNFKHEWEATVDSRSNGSRCPYCTGKRLAKL